MEMNRWTEGRSKALGDNMTKKEERLRQKQTEEETKGRGRRGSNIRRGSHAFCCRLTWRQLPSPPAIRAPTNPLSRTLIKKKTKFYKEIQMGSGAKSYMRKGFPIYEEMRKFFPIYEEAF